MSSKRGRYIITGFISLIVILIILILGMTLNGNSSSEKKNHKESSVHQKNKKLSIVIKDGLNYELSELNHNTYTTSDISSKNTLYVETNKPSDVVLSADKNIKIQKYKINKLKYKIIAYVPNTDSPDGAGNVHIKVTDGNNDIKRKIYLPSPIFTNAENAKKSIASKISSSKEKKRINELLNSSDDTKVNSSSEPSEPDYADKLQDEIVGSGSCTNISFSKDEDKNYIINVTGYEGWSNYNNEQLNYKIQNVVERMNVIVNRESTYMPEVNFFLPNGTKIAYTEFNDIDYIHVINKN